MEEEISGPPAALIMGVTGMAGLSLAEALNKPTTPCGPWKVYGVARRPLSSWFPSSLLHHFIALDATDHTDTAQKLSPVAHKITHVFWVVLQVHENEEVRTSINSTMLANVLDALKSATPSRLKHFTLQTGTQHYMGPINDPSFIGKLVHREPPFQEDSPRLPYPNFYYALEDLIESSLPPHVTYSIHRSSIIIGASSRSVYNCLVTLAVYAAICRYEGLQFRYPGSIYTWEHFCDMTDAEVLAEQHIWAAVTDRAKNQAFNCSNGDVFTWKGLWKVLCQVFDVELGSDDQSFNWVEMMNGKGQVWDEIVEKYGLIKTKIEDITCFAAVNMVLHFGFQHVCSMNKSREFGFLGYADTAKRIRMWVGRLRDMKIIP